MPFVPTYAAAIKNGIYLINFDEYTNIGTPWISIYVKNNASTYLIALEMHIFLKTFIGNKFINLGDPNVNKNHFGSFLGHPCHLRSRGIFFRFDSLLAKCFCIQSLTLPFVSFVL